MFNDLLYHKSSLSICRMNSELCCSRGITGQRKSATLITQISCNKLCRHNFSLSHSWLHSCWEPSVSVPVAAGNGTVVDGARYNEELSDDSGTGHPPPFLHYTHPAHWKQQLCPDSCGDKKHDQMLPVLGNKAPGQHQVKVNLCGLCWCCCHQELYTNVHFH